MSLFWSKTVQTLTPYTPGEQIQLDHLIKLNTNESPYGPSPKALAAIANATNNSLRLYPPPNSNELKNGIAKAYGLEHSQVFVGNGSDEVLAHIFLGLLKHSAPILFPDITYSFYPVYCNLYEIPYQLIPLDHEFNIQIDDYLARPQNAGIIFPNPNAPTGKAIPVREIKRLLHKNTHSVVVIDEAYVDFGAESSVHLLEEFNQLIVTHSLSKSRALAGLRIGYALASPHLIEGLERVKNSFNSYPLSRLAQAGGLAAIEDQDYFRSSCEKIQNTRAVFMQELSKLGFDTLDSQANFVFTKHSKIAAHNLYTQLRAENILVRHFAIPRIENFLRITIGTDEQCAQCIITLKKILSSAM